MHPASLSRSVDMLGKTSIRDRLVDDGGSCCGVSVLLPPSPPQLSTCLQHD